MRSGQDLDPLSWQEKFRANYIYLLYILYIYIYIYIYTLYIIHNIINNIIIIINNIINNIYIYIYIYIYISEKAFTLNISLVMENKRILFAEAIDREIKKLVDNLAKRKMQKSTKISTFVRLEKLFGALLDK